MQIEDRIERWRGENSQRETEDYVVLLCDAEEEIRRLRGTEGELLGQVVTFDKPAKIQVIISTHPDAPEGAKSFAIVEHSFVNAYDVRLDAKGKKIRLVLDLEQVETSNSPETDLMFTRNP